MNLLEIIRNVVAALDSFGIVLSATCFLVGVVMGISALLQAQRRQVMGPGQGSWGAPLATFVTAVMFIALPQFVQVLNGALFGIGMVSPQSILSYAPSTIGRLSTGAAREMLLGITAIVQFIGLIAVARGLLLLNRSAQGGPGPQTFGPGLTFVIAGTLATNFPVFVGILEKLILP
ncbi:MAG: hypothetical protein F4213_08495 [Boseongicola sp. SB0677_bin_26]|nr:hypothetical protein [Boseongicola sp. SB0665_bin_10]MYG26050.1 hypothetical protein [Boseongicola sp. SB0677_bin_26]